MGPESVLNGPIPGEFTSPDKVACWPWWIEAAVLLFIVGGVVVFVRPAQYVNFRVEDLKLPFSSLDPRRRPYSAWLKVRYLCL